MRACIFCGGRANSLEHVWPDWLLKQLRDAPILGASGDRRVVIQGPNASAKVRHVCSTCNNGWMSRLESTAKQVILPLVQGKPAMLNERQQTLLSQWMTKTVMVSELLDASHQRFFSSQDCKAIMDRLALPPNTSAWLGHYIGRRSLFVGGVELGPENKEPAGGIVYTLTFGRLAMQVISVRNTKDQRPVRVRVNAGHWAASLIEIWPTGRNLLSWPPLEAFTDAGVLTLRMLLDRFNTSKLVPPIEI